MKFKFTFLLVIAALSLFAQNKKAKSQPAAAQTEEDKKWDVNNPPGDNWNWKPVQFTTDEGTWMTVDVSPDGNRVFPDTRVGLVDNVGPLLQFQLLQPLDNLA